MCYGPDGRDIETDLILMGVRGKALLIVKAQEGFSAVALDEEDCSRIAQYRKHLSAKTIAEATRLIRIAVKEGQIWLP